MMSSNEFAKFEEIDRSEIIEQIYYHRDGKLDLVDEFYDVKPWTQERKNEFIKGFKDLNDRGGFFFGAFDGERLVGMSTLDVQFIGKNLDQLNLSGLWVDVNYRKLGVATKLLELAKTKAKEIGAKKLYISATPSYNTIEFYKNRGCRVTRDVNKDLFEKEPEDIHLELDL